MSADGVRIASGHDSGRPAANDLAGRQLTSQAPLAARLNSSDAGETACNSRSTTNDSSTAPDKL